LEHTFCTERAIPARWTFAYKGRVAAFTYTVAFVLAFEFSAWSLFVTRISGEFLGDQTDIYNNATRNAYNMIEK